MADLSDCWWEHLLRYSIMARLSKEPLFAEKAAAMGINIGQVEITPPTVRRKLWFGIQTTMAEIAEEGGWQFVPVAQETMG